MSIKRCCMNNCDNEESADVCLFNFPTDFNLCMLWVQNTGKPKHFEEFAFGGALPFLNLYICSEHFSSVDFVDVKNKRLGLLPGAVPLLNYIELSNDTKIKEEVIDPEFNESAEEISRLGSELEPDNLGDDSFPGIESIKIEPNEEEKLLSDKFFSNYKDAQKRKSKKAKRAKAKKKQGTQESDEQRKMKNMKKALRAAIRRQNESPEQRNKRRLNDALRARRRRNAETEQETRIRRYNDAVRAALRRKNETDEQRAERRMYDSRRAALRRSQESSEQRALRLKKDRERASRNRLLKRIFKQIQVLESTQECLAYSSEDIRQAGNTDMHCDVPLDISTISTAVKGCNEFTNLNRLQEVLSFLQETNKKQTDIEAAQMKAVIENVHRSSSSTEEDSFQEGYIESPVQDHELSINQECCTEDYSVNFSDIPKEIRKDIEAAANKNNDMTSTAMEDENFEDFMETPVTVELHVDTDQIIDNPEDTRNVFELINKANGMTSNEAYCRKDCSANLLDIPKEIREKHLDDSGKDINWENGTGVD